MLYQPSGRVTDLWFPLPYWAVRPQSSSVKPVSGRAGLDTVGVMV